VYALGVFIVLEQCNCAIKTTLGARRSL